MGTEIERKFLVTDSSWKRDSMSAKCRQGYVCLGSGTTIRVRVMADKGYLTIKGRSSGAARKEFEYRIPVADAEEMFECICEKPLIEKDRYTLHYEGMTWEIDEFAGENIGLVVAEVELEREDQVFLLPPWVGKEVTGDPRYYNVALVRNPYSKWDSPKS